MSLLHEPTFLSDEGVWVFSTVPKISFEILVGGDINVPNPVRRALVERVLLQIDPAVKAAKDYLDTFVDRARFAGATDWFFEGIEAGRNANDPLQQFTLSFSIEGDPYGFWSVTYQETKYGNNPINFARKQQ